MKVTDAQVYHAWRSSLAAAPDAFISWWGIRAALESLDVQVVGPGQVAVDAATLRAVRDNGGDVGGAVWARIDAALAAANPVADGDTPVASGGGTEADGDQGETWEPPVKGFDLLRVSESDDETLVTGGLYGDKVIDLPDTPAAEPQRVTLPDTPWTTVRVTFERGSQEVWRTNALRGFWMKNDHAVVVKPHEAELTEVTILAQPPKADPAETDAPAPINDWRAYVDGKVGVAIDIARDEALAEFYSALDVAYARATPETAPDELMRLLRALIADAIERQREAGGDGA